MRLPLWINYNCCIFLCTFFAFIYTREVHWDWSSIDPTAVFFPKNFIWGCADSALQTEGLVSSNGVWVENSWTDYEKKFNPPVMLGQSCERWTRYEQDFDLLKQTGMSAYRFSIDWSKIEPHEGRFDQVAMQHYIDVVDALLARGLQPVITLLHHICPLWFMRKGGFEQADNIRYFERFARFVCDHLHTKVRMWITINEPIAYAFEGYFRGVYPPNKKSLTTAGYVMINLLNAHVAVAEQLRSIDSSIKIGIAHMCHPIDAYSKWNLFEQSITKLFSYLMNETTITFFKTGTFKWLPPWVRCHNPKAPQSLDFFGVNYYTHTTIKQTGLLTLKPCVRPDEPLVDFSGDNDRSKVMYPEGLYRSIVRASKLNIPLYVTENGVATEDPFIKDDYIKKHLYVISRALQEGYDVRGYFFWTLTDCFSWNKGYKNKHGIYAVDFTTQERVLRPCVGYLLDVVKRFSA